MRQSMGPQGVRHDRATEQQVRGTKCYVENKPQEMWPIFCNNCECGVTFKM